MKQILYFVFGSCVLGRCEPVACVPAEAGEQGEPGAPCVLCRLQPRRRDGGHWHEEWRVHHPAGQQPQGLGQEAGQEVCNPGHQVGGAQDMQPWLEERAVESQVDLQRFCKSMFVESYVSC